MALSESRLSTALNTAFKKQRDKVTKSDDPDADLKELCDELSKAFIDEVKNADLLATELDSVFEGVAPVPQDGGTAANVQYIANSKQFETITLGKLD